MKYQKDLVLILLVWSTSTPLNTKLKFMNLGANKKKKSYFYRSVPLLGSSPDVVERVDKNDLVLHLNTLHAYGQFQVCHGTSVWRRCAAKKLNTTFFTKKKKVHDKFIVQQKLREFEIRNDPDQNELGLKSSGSTQNWASLPYMKNDHKWDQRFPSCSVHKTFKYCGRGKLTLCNFTWTPGSFHSIPLELSQWEKCRNNAEY